MKTYIQSIFTLASFYLITGCSSDSEAHDDHAHEHGSETEVMLSTLQVEGMHLTTDVLKERNLGEYVEVNGQLEVPPQNEASVTAIIGANVTSIKVIEGDKINKGQVLAYLSHPDLIKVQTDYINTWSQMEYIEQDYKRQEKLYEENVSSGRDFQKAKSEYLTKNGQLKGLESQLKMMSLDINKIQEGHLYELVPVRSPIEGFVRAVEVKTGQFVQPQKEMFEIVNIDHIHADFMVFEKDIHKVKKGQKIEFSVATIEDKTLMATIHSVGKAFEQDPKAIHLHAEIENKEGLLIPGMYVRGRILTSEEMVLAIPLEGLTQQDGKAYVFSVNQKFSEGKATWIFEPIEVIVGLKNDRFAEVRTLMEFKKGQLFAQNSAYILMAELKKEEAEHSH